MFDPITMKLNVDPLILSALQEDITNDDVSTNSVMPYAQLGEVDLICKQDGIICGLQIFERVFTLLDEAVRMECQVADGSAVSDGQLIEVEVETLDMVKEAVEAGADIIMLDNMTHSQMKEAIQYIAGRAEVEVSGNVTKENITALTDLGVDYISSGALTHSAPILDLSLKNLHAVTRDQH